MFDFLSTTINLINLPLTVLLALIFLYWAGVILGAVDVELFDFDMETDVELSGDMDGGTSGSPLMALLQFLNVGEIPIMIVLSILIFLLWAISILANHYLNPSYSLLWGTVLLIPNFLLSLLIAKIVTSPIRTIFRKLEKQQEIKSALYQTGVAVTSEINETFGQVEITTEGAPITVNARTENGLILKNGDRVMVYNQDKEKGIFYVDQL